MKERILWLDNLKGFLILIVILGHTILFTDGTWDHNIVSRYIISFWMYLFMFTSGFASFKTELHLSSIKRRFCQLIIPFILWSLFLSIFNDDYSFLDMMLYPGHSVWFLYALFFISTINLIVCKYSNYIKLSDGLVNILVTVVLLALAKFTKGTDLFALSSISLYYSSYNIGWYCRKHWSAIMKHFNWCTFSFFSIVFVTMAYFNEGAFMPFGLPKSLHLGYDIVCGTMSFGLFAFIFIKSFNRKQLILSKLGGGTLGLYTSHIAIFTVLFHYFHNLRIPGLDALHYLLYVAALFLAVTLVSWMIYKLLGLNKYTAFLFLGKQLSK